jgi:hypothetical protein
LVTAVAGVVLVLIMAGIAGGSSNKENKASDLTSLRGASGTPSTQPTTTPKSQGPTQPALQRRFDAIVKIGQDAADGANEFQVVKARKARNSAICGLLPANKAVTGWLGTVHSAETTLGGDSGVLSLYIGDDIKASTWNNSLSDAFDHTLISPDSPLYDVLSNLNEGDKVVFSGSFIRDSKSCISEQSLIDENGLLTPEFAFRFKSIRKA